MTSSVQTRIVRIGNSQGIRIPKPLLEQTGIGDRVELEVRDGQICVRPARRPRAGWDEQFQSMAAARDDRLLDGGSGPATSWDEEEWVW